MAVRRSQNWINQQRVDVPHLRSVESAVRNDFDELFSAFVLGESESYVIRGFELEMTGSIGASANSLQMIVDDSAILHGKSNESGTFFNVASGTANQVLSSTTNERVDGAFTPSSLNYISLEFTREVDDNTTSQLYLWNPTTKNEITKTLPLAETLDYKIVISSSIFSSNVLPIAIVETDSSNNVLSVQDRRPMLFRLGTAGITTPDPFYEYPWTNDAEGREENFWQSSSSSVSPFRGGDKQIKTFKENDEAIKTELKLIKGTQYWYSENIGGSIAGLRYDLANTILTGRGSISHDAGDAGLINWDEDIFLTVLSTRIKYKLEANAASGDINLDDKQVAYIKIVRNVDISPQLVFTNGATTVTSVGAIDWTADLEDGDFIKVASEEDTAYYQIATVDSTTQVTLTENFGGTSTGPLGTDAKYAWGNYRTDAAPSTDRHIKVANLDDMPFDADTFWLFFRDDNAGISRIYVRFLNAELKQGETITIADQVPAAVLAYMGSSSDADADPNYADLATGAKTGTENYNSVQGENLTIRSSKLTSMVADKAQDKTIKFVSDYTIVANTTNAANQDITFTGGSGSGTIIIPSSTDNNTIGLGGTLSLAANQAAYYSIDRNASSSIADLSGLTVGALSSVPLDENTYIFAYRLADTTVYLWNGDALRAGDSIDLSLLRGYVQQNKTAKLVKGGTWSWDLLSNTLTSSAASFIQVGGLAENVNEISAQSIVLPSDGQCAYVTAKRTAGASILAVSVADIASVPQDDHTFIIARRTGDQVIVGTSSFALKDEEFLELDGALGEINRYFGQLRVLPHNPLNTRVRITGSDILKLNGSKLSLEQKNVLLDFEGAEIDFATGEIFEANGLTPWLGGANDFTPPVIPANEFLYYSITIVGNTKNADNTISARIVVNAASGTDAALASAPKATFASSGLKLANVYVQENGAGGILNVDYANVIQLGVGSGGGGGAAATRDIEETAHGFIVGTQIYGDDVNGWARAEADDGDKLTVYTVVEVIDANNITVQRDNVAEIEAHGFTVGQYYFLDPASPGDPTLTDPQIAGIPGTFSCTAFYVLNANELLILNDERPVAAGTTPNIVSDPIGKVSIWMDDTVPSGFLRCEGQAVSRTTYSELFALWGENFGSGDGSTTFNIPDYRGLAVRGVDNGAGLDVHVASRTDRGDGTTGDAVGTKQPYYTARPILSSFVTNTTGSHSHTFTTASGGGATVADNASVDGSGSQSPSTNAAGNHNHTITAGGDGETVMRNISSYFIVRATNPAVAINDFALAIDATTGASDAGKTILTNADGLLDPTFLGSVLTNTVSSTYSVLTSDRKVGLNYSGGTFSTTLYTPIGNAGSRVEFVKTDSTFTNGTIVNPSGPDFNIATENERLIVESDGSTWFIADRYIPPTKFKETVAFSGLGVNPGLAYSNIIWSRDGKDLVGMVVARKDGNAGSGTGNVRFTLPQGLQADMTLINPIASYDACVGNGNVSSTVVTLAVITGFPTEIFFPSSGAAVAGNTVLSASIRVPIDGWDV